MKNKSLFDELAADVDQLGTDLINIGESMDSILDRLKELYHTEENTETLEYIGSAIDHFKAAQKTYIDMFNDASDGASMVASI